MCGAETQVEDEDAKAQEHPQIVCAWICVHACLILGMHLYSFFAQQLCALCGVYRNHIQILSDFYHVIPLKAKDVQNSVDLNLT